ncbi:hypothetical protein CYMTET_12717 [Cymbomonas tetramitiformis]|uniref:Uncharacterized protein n=1 Tax=Cymbomonas tetramitiformis TaxID=36881 RepID=A0AAE0LBS2_9CHLO|nr:hypothetical protein CYMTET_12717 [Cymbomonas tetramitiformis]
MRLNLEEKVDPVPYRLTYKAAARPGYGDDQMLAVSLNGVKARQDLLSERFRHYTVLFDTYRTFVTVRFENRSPEDGTSGALSGSGGSTGYMATVSWNTNTMDPYVQEINGDMSVCMHPGDSMTSQDMEMWASCCDDSGGALYRDCLHGQEVTHEEAQRVCSSAGGRLCTQEEVEQGAVVTAGCHAEGDGNDGSDLCENGCFRHWTSTPCNLTVENIAPPPPSSETRTTLVDAVHVEELVDDLRQPAYQDWLYSRTDYIYCASAEELALTTGFSSVSDCQTYCNKHRECMVCMWSECETGTGVALALPSCDLRRSSCGSYISEKDAYWNTYLSFIPEVIAYEYALTGQNNNSYGGFRHCKDCVSDVVISSKADCLTHCDADPTCQFAMYYEHATVKCYTVSQCGILTSEEEWNDGTLNEGKEDICKVTAVRL